MERREELVTVGVGVRKGGGQGSLLGGGDLLEAEEGGGGDVGGRGDGGAAAGGGVLPGGELGSGGDGLLGRLQEALPHRWRGWGRRSEQPPPPVGGAAGAAAAEADGHDECMNRTVGPNGLEPTLTSVHGIARGSTRGLICEKLRTEEKLRNLQRDWLEKNIKLRLERKNLELNGFM